MSDADMIAAITAAIQDDSILIILIRNGVARALAAMQTQQLQLIMTNLNLPMDPPSDG